MKLLLLLAFCGLLVIQIETKTNDCKEECNDTEYHAYVDCIRKRMKRSTDCDNVVSACEDCDNNSCQDCDCDFCAVNSCQPSCNNCCPNNPPCTTNRCCHKTCHARCKSSTCRTECRKTCGEKVNGGGANITVGEKSRHNITTVINLHNTINNTNIIDIPVQVNNTNINNITLGSEESTSGSQETCCYVVSPRQCVPTEKYPYVKCFHYRRKVCGHFCRAPIIHEQPHEICDQTAAGTSCHQQIAYIPQPQPRCAYQSTWPYVSCGVPQQQFCGGCYQHYASPVPQMPPMGCSPGCYDDGYGLGPYYRQGPFYRPGYAHVPSCYQTGTCNPYGYGNFGGGYGGAYGGFGFPTPSFGGFPAPSFGGFPGVGYAPNTYENSVHFETDPSNVVARKNRTAVETKGEEVEEPPPPAYYPFPMIPQYGAVGYPYPPPVPPYKLPPEVDIQATITHPEKESRYAQITIDKQHSKRASNKKEEKQEKEEPIVTTDSE